MAARNSSAGSARRTAPAAPLEGDHLVGDERLVVPDRRDHQRHPGRQRLADDAHPAMADHRVQVRHQPQGRHPGRDQEMSRQVRQNVDRGHHDHLEPVGLVGQRRHDLADEVDGDPVGQRTDRDQDMLAAWIQPVPPEVGIDRAAAEGGPTRTQLSGTDVAPINAEDANTITRCGENRRSPRTAGDKPAAVAN